MRVVRSGPGGKDGGVGGTSSLYSELAEQGLVGECV